MTRIFNKFTNQYSLRKTLRFELIPIGEDLNYVDPKTGQIKRKNATEKMLLENKIFKIDQSIQRKYEQTKVFFDKLHRDFVKSALSDVFLEGLNEYLNYYKEYKRDGKNKNILKKLEKQEKELRKQIKNFFNSKANKWKKKYDYINFKKSGKEILFEVPQVFALLKKFYGGDKDAFLKNENKEYVLDEKGNKISIFDSWKNFGGYFTKFFETRKNFYKDDGTSTAIATRIVDQNLRRFCDNLLLFESVKDEIDFTEVEKDFNISLSDYFDILKYSKILLQNNIDAYNKIIGGETKENGTKLRGLNEIINKYRQDHKNKKIAFFKKLDKQILSKGDKKFIDEIESDEELGKILKEFVKNAQEKIKIFDKLISELLENTQDFELDKIYISKGALNTIVYKWTNQTYAFEKALYERMKTDKPGGLSYNKKEDTYKFPDFVALQYIVDALNSLNKDLEFWKSYYYENNGLKLGENIGDQFLLIYKKELDKLHSRESIDENGERKYVGIDYFLKEMNGVLNNFNLNDKTRTIIKNFADDILRYYQIAKYFSVEKKREWNFAKLDLGVFYTNPDFGYEKFYENAYEEIVQIYNKIRNYLTKKPFSEKKWKLNFENATLAGGWDRNKERDYLTIILRKENRYFLGIMHKNHNDIFSDKNKNKFEGDGYEKMIYKLFPGPNKMMPKVCFSKKGLEFFKPSAEIIDIYKSEKFKRGDNFSLQAMHKLIDFYKRALLEYDGWKVYDFSKLKKTEEYNENIGEFYSDVANVGYKISWQNISEDYIKEKNKNGELYLFEIHNKDWNKGANGKKNLHTLYFESLFSPENEKNNFLTKLSGEAELFFRPKTDEKKLGYRKDGNGKRVIKSKRYAQDKIFLHLSISLNRGKGDVFRFNQKINDFLANNPDINIIGVDRGEKHLAYYSVINQKGEILDGGSLNKIGGVDYYDKLSKRAKTRETERKDWKQVSDIKNLKKGYISQVVRKLADLAIKHNAIIVLEDLNMRFKQIRGGIEKSVYQQLEKALIEKLNFLVNKNEKDSTQAGHLLRAYQLTAPFTTFKDMGKQTGIIFYTQASYTSKIDPLTGWRPNLYLHKGNAQENKKQILAFKKIFFNQEKERFEFAYDLKEFDKKIGVKQKKEYPQKTEWTLCSSMERWRWNKKLNNNKGGYEYYENLTKNFQELFEKYNIDVNKDVLGQIKNMDTKGNEKFFSDFIYFWGLLCQIRNTDGNLDDKIKKLERENKVDEIAEKDKLNVDFILSPVEPFFDSRQSEKFSKNLPQNGDDNGAYNIARKGVIILNKISDFVSKNQTAEKLKWGDLFISHTDWDNFAVKNAN